MKGTLSRSWPLYVSTLALLLLTGLTLNISINHNQGHQVYALDDAYIHMAMAKNFSQFGVWGVTRYGFTPASSSPLWTLLLSLTYHLGGVNPLAPLLWNLGFAVLFLVLANAVLSWYKARAAVKLITLLAIVFLVPLPVLILSGMEQTLQTLLSVFAVFLAARLISEESPGSARRDAAGLLILAPLASAARFEGMFLIAIICGLFLLRSPLALRSGLRGLWVSPGGCERIYPGVPGMVLVSTSVPAQSFLAGFPFPAASFSP